MNPTGWDTNTAKLVLDSLVDGVYVTDQNRRIVLWNAAAEQLTGWHASEIIGTSCFDDILAHEDSEGQRMCGEDTCPLHRAIVSGQQTTLPSMVFARTKSGQRIPVEVSVAPVRDADGNIVGGVESFRDLTPLLRDMKHARAIQDFAMNVAPPNDPRIEMAAVNVPSEYVTGDFYRGELLGDGILALMVADIMGHGLSAALHTMQIRSLWEESRHLLNKPAQFMHHLNNQLYAVTQEEDFFATVFYGALDLNSRTLRYVVAGHPEPRVFRDGEIVPLNGHSPVLGLLPKIEIQEQTAELVENDVLLCFSDGATEIIGKNGEELGGEGLCRLFADCDAKTLDGRLQQLEQLALGYNQQVRFADDFTLMALRISAAAGKGEVPTG